LSIESDDMRMGRLVALILAVERRGGATADELADELEVSVRTIYRYVSALQAAGVPLWTETGPRGGIRLVDGWRAPVDGFTAQEATALLVGATGAADLGLGGVLAVARSKVQSALPAGDRAVVESVGRRVHLDAAGWFQRTDDLSALSALVEGLWSDRRVDLRYLRGDRTVHRRVDPLGLVLKAGTWYLVAAHRGQPRTYRVGRIARARVRAESVVRPADFDLARYWAQSAVEFDLAIRPLRARLRLSLRALQDLRRVIPGPATDAAITGAGAPDADGWCEVVIPLEPVPVASTLLAQLGEVEVLEPAELRAALRAHGASLVASNTPR
jgi:predicted DNA-binding transcriptional regulator YafY